MPAPPQWLSLNNLHRDSKLSFDSNNLVSYLFFPVCFPFMHDYSCWNHIKTCSCQEKQSWHKLLQHMHFLTSRPKLCKSETIKREQELRDNNTFLWKPRNWYDIICLPWGNFSGTWVNSQQEPSSFLQIPRKKCLQNSKQRCETQAVFLFLTQ